MLTGPDMSGQDPFLPVNEHGSFFQIAEELFARVRGSLSLSLSLSLSAVDKQPGSQAQGVHRAPVTDDSGKILGMVSQSDIVGLLAKSKTLFSDPLAAK